MSITPGLPRIDRTTRCLAALTLALGMAATAPGSVPGSTPGSVPGNPGNSVPVQPAVMADEAPASSSAKAKPYEVDDATALLFHLDEAAGVTSAAEAVAGRHATVGSAAKLGEATLDGLTTGLRGAAGLNTRVTFIDRGMGATTFLLPANTPSLTIEAWLRLDEQDFERDRVIIAVQPAGTALPDYSLSLFGTSNQWHARGLYFRDRRSSTVIYTQGGLKWEPGQWYHVALVIQENAADPARTSYKIYRTPAGQKDAILVAEKTDTPPQAHDSQADRQFEIGNFYGSNGQQFFPGLIDEVRFSVVARQPADFTTLQP